MHARLLLALVLAAPFAGANFVSSGTTALGVDAPHVPQAYCEVVLTESTGRCDGFNLDVRSAHILRLRITGVGHAIAYADLHPRGTTCTPATPCHQIPFPAYMDCEAKAQAPSVVDPTRTLPAYAMCSAIVNLAAPGYSGLADLHVIADRATPGTTYSLWMERIVAPLP